MAKRQPKPEGERVPEAATKKPNRTGVPLHIWIPPTLREALERLAAKRRRPLTTEVVIALEKHLTDEGELPQP
jgi:hypothetical protein